MGEVRKKTHAKPRVEIRVITADGSVFSFGEQRPGKILGPISRWWQNFRIERYRKSRGL